MLLSEYILMTRLYFNYKFILILYVGLHEMNDDAEHLLERGARSFSQPTEMDLSF